MQRRITHKVHYTTEMPQRRRGPCIFLYVASVGARRLTNGKQVVWIRKIP